MLKTSARFSAFQDRHQRSLRPTQRAKAPDFAEAVIWFQKGADAGDTESLYNLGVCYFNGTGVTKGAAKAIDWFSKGAKLGNANAKSAIERLGSEWKN